jgi:hypothetical protein
LLPEHRFHLFRRCLFRFYSLEDEMPTPEFSLSSGRSVSAGKINR